MDKKMVLAVVTTALGVGLGLVAYNFIQGQMAKGSASNGATE